MVYKTSASYLLRVTRGFKNLKFKIKYKPRGQLHLTPVDEDYAYLRRSLTRLPSATNWQVPDLTLEAWTRSVPLLALAKAA